MRFFDPACHHRISFTSGMVISVLAKHYLPTPTYQYDEPQYRRDMLRRSCTGQPTSVTGKAPNLTNAEVPFTVALADLFTQMDKTELLNIWKIPCVLLDLIQYSLFAAIDHKAETVDGDYEYQHQWRHTVKQCLSIVFLIAKLPFHILQIPFLAADYSSDIIRNWTSATPKQRTAAVLLTLLNLAIAVAAIFTLVGFKSHTIPLMTKMAHTFSTAANWIGQHTFVGKAIATVCSKLTLAFSTVRNTAAFAWASAVALGIAKKLGWIRSKNPGKPITTSWMRKKPLQIPKRTAVTAEQAVGFTST